MVIGLDDFAELLELARAGEDRRKGIARLDDSVAQELRSTLKGD